MFAREHAQVCEIIRLCARHRVPVTARGRGTGTAGAAVPAPHGISISFERMNRILDIDAANRVAIAEPGVINADLQSACAREGFFWPPDPSSADYCTVGGNLACNAAGPRAVRYGTPRENTLGLTAVSGEGISLRTGCYTSKGVVGYDLTRLLIGSEGTLALITQATLRLTALPDAVRTLRIACADFASAAAAVGRIMTLPVSVSALEFMDRHALALIRAQLDDDLPAGTEAILLVEVDGLASAMSESLQQVQKAATAEGTLQVRCAHSEDERRKLWQARKALSPALRKIAPDKINEDIVVPVSHMPRLLAELDTLASRYGITIVNFGHAGNGNIHVNLLTDAAQPGAQARAEDCLREVFTTVLELGGTLSGEHGMGFEKRAFLGLEIEPATLEMMIRIRQQFDPRQILNPDKLFPSAPSDE